mgnify:CR=1 FL=1
MSLSEEQIIIHINSNERLQGTHSEFSARVELPRDKSYDSVCLLQAYIPKSYYLVQEGRNSFILEEDSTQVDIIVPIGNYSRRSLQTKLNFLLNSISPNNWVYQVSYPNINSEPELGKFTFTVSNNTSQPKFIFNNSFAEILGFNKNSDNSFSLDILVPPNVMNLQIENTVYIHSNICNTGNSDILALAIGNNDNSFRYISYQVNNVEASTCRLLTRDKNTYNFILTNENNEVLNTNGINVILVLLIYKKNPFYDRGLKYMRYKIAENFNL